MPNNIYPDFTRSRFDIEYTPSIAFITGGAGLVTRTPVAPQPGTIPDVPEPVSSDENIDGGTWDAVYTPSQKINGGTFS